MRCWEEFDLEPEAGSRDVGHGVWIGESNLQISVGRGGSLLSLLAYLVSLVAVHGVNGVISLSFGVGEAEMVPSINPSR